MTTIYRPGVNPARALYRLWNTIFTSAVSPERSLGTVRQQFDNSHLTAGGMSTTTRGWPVVGFGRPGAVIGLPGWLNGRPVFALGQGNTGWMYVLFLLLADGRFSMHVPRGNQARNLVEESTFLDWNSVASRIQWNVSLVHGSHYQPLQDWRRPRHYVPQAAMNLNNWMRLEPHESGWAIVPATNQDPGGKLGRAVAETRYKFLSADMAAYERLRLKRYRRLELEQRREETGEMLSPRPPRTITLRSGSETLNEVDAARALSVLMDVSQPAKSTPLVRKRPAEAQEGI